MAASSGTHRARPVERLRECPCELLGAATTDHVSFDQRPANVLSDAGDRDLVLNVARIALSVHVGTAGAIEWGVEEDGDDEQIINVMVKYPHKTCFTDQQIELIKLVNQLRVRSVWVQPEDDCVYIGVALWRSDVVGKFTVQDVVIVRRAVDADTEAAKPPTRKRARVSAKRS
jgi:hypothetical protein